MPSLILQYGHDILKEYDLGESLTIGRLPDNTVVIDNPAVSGHHARVSWDGSHFVVEDLNSTNGTYVNEKRVIRHLLQDGDVVLVGKHKLVYDPMTGGEPVIRPTVGPTLTSLQDTVYLDTKKHKELLAKTVPAPAARVTVGVLRVLSGRAEMAEYRLDRHTTVIGRSERAIVRLHGWWKPKVAVVITRAEDTYVATRLSGWPRVNNESLTGRHPLADGDVLSVNGLMLEFSIRPLVQEVVAAPHLVMSGARRIAGSA
jgi:predicted component of type VI protein secretion system